MAAGAEPDCRAPARRPRIAPLFLFTAGHPQPQRGTTTLTDDSAIAAAAMIGTAAGEPGRGCLRDRDAAAL